MARIARLVVPGLPHHVTHRGNRREPVFFGAAAHRLYRRLIAAAARRAGADLGLLPGAQSSPPDRDADRPGRVAGSPRRTAVTPVPSTLGSDGPAIYSRAASARW